MPVAPDTREGHLHIAKRDAINVARLSLFDEHRRSNPPCHWRAPEPVVDPHSPPPEPMAGTLLLARRGVGLLAEWGLFDWQREFSPTLSVESRLAQGVSSVCEPMGRCQLDFIC